MFRHSAHHRGKLTPTLQALSCRLSLPLGNPTPQITIGSCSSGAHCPCCEVSRGVSPREKLEQSRLLLTVRHGSFYNTVDFSVGLSCWVCFTSHCCMPGLSRYWGKGKYKCALGANWHLSLPPPLLCQCLHMTQKCQIFFLKTPISNLPMQLCWIHGRPTRPEKPTSDF